MSIAIAFPSAEAFAPAGDHTPLARFIGQDELVDRLLDSRGAKTVTLEARTEPRLLARHPVTGEPNPCRGNVAKISRVNGMIGWHYASSVNRQRTREDMTPDFDPFRRKWGRRLSPTPLVEYGGRYFLEVKVERVLAQRYEALDSRLLDAAEVEPYLPSRSSSRQGISREVVLRDYALDSIVSLRMDGTIYFVSSGIAAGRTERARLSA